MSTKKYSAIKAELTNPESKKFSHVKGGRKSDVDAIMEGLKKITSNDALFMQTLIDAGIYTKTGKLRKEYR